MRVNTINLKDKKILITQNHMVNLGGSEVITLEMIDYFVNMNAIVYLYCTIVGGLAHTQLSKRKVNIVVANSTDVLKMEKVVFDFAFIHHSLIPPNLLTGLNKKNNQCKIIWHHMSYYLALEMPFLYKIESNISDLILYNSVETQEAINKRVKIAKSRQLVFPNPVPDSFYTKPRKETLKIKKVIAISNHLTLEVKKALKLLNEQNISTEFIGLPNNQKIVDEKLLKNVDVVISIGKTVQYCLATATPVYCYDHFGGPGYLNTHNFGKAKKLNFSGRGFKRKNSNTIKNEIIKGFLQNQKDIISLRRKFGDSFKLSENMNTIFTKVNNNPKPNKTINKYDLISAIDINEIRVSDQQAIYAQNIYILHSDLFIKKAKSDLDYVKNSMSWKVTKPLRNINDAIGKLKSRKQK